MHHRPPVVEIDQEIDELPALARLVCQAVLHVADKFRPVASRYQITLAVGSHQPPGA